MKYLEKIIKTIFNIIIIIFVVAVIIVVYNFIQINFLNKKYSNLFGYTFFNITTGSMSGTMEVDDIIVVKITDDVSINDVITFEKNDEIITHRIIGENDGKFITKGDANNGSDAPIEKGMIIGKVVKVFGKLGIWMKVLSDIKVIICIIITILFFGLAISNDNSEKDSNKRKKRNHFSRFIRNVRGIKSNDEKEKKKE